MKISSASVFGYTVSDNWLLTIGYGKASSFIQKGVSLFAALASVSDWLLQLILAIATHPEVSQAEMPKLESGCCAS